MFTVNSKDRRVCDAAIRLMRHVGEPNPYCFDPKPMTVADVVALLKIRFKIRSLTIDVTYH